jgi:type IV pilus assembly protein PilC
MPGLGLRKFLLRKGLSLSQLHLFTIHLHLMFRNGIGLHEALRILATQVEEVPAASARFLEKDLERGLRFSAALKRQPESFPDSYIRVIAAGEESGALENSLKRLATDLEKQSRIRQNLTSALIYPAFLLAGCGTLVFIMLYLIFPMVISVTSDAGVDPPALTMMVMTLTQPWVGFSLMAGVVIFGLALSAIWRSDKRGPGMRRLFERYTPVGNFILQVGILESTRQLSLLLSSGVDLLRSLTFAGRAVGSSILLTEAYAKIVKDVRMGSDLVSTFGAFEFFPPMMISMLAVSEEAGGISDALDHFCICLEDDLDMRLRNFTTLLEPVMLGAMGGIIGVLLVAAFLPIYDLILI